MSLVPSTYTQQLRHFVSLAQLVIFLCLVMNHLDYIIYLIWNLCY